MRRVSLKAARIAKRWTQARLEAETKRRGTPVAQSAISKIEREQVNDPQASTVEALEGALGLRPGTLRFTHERVSA